MSATATTTAIELERVITNPTNAGKDGWPSHSPPSAHSSDFPSNFPSSSATTTPTTPHTSSPPPSTLDREITPLAPADRGRQAWLFLLGATLIETTIWGLLNAVGILQHYWTTEKFKGHEETVTLAAALMNGLCFMSTGVFGPVFAALPHHTRTIQVVGLVVSSIGLIATAFVDNPVHLIGTVGVLYPFAAALYLPCATMIYEWFYTRRGLASGIMFAGTGVGGTVFPFVLDGLLRRFGYKATMVSLGLGFFAINAVSLVFIRRRIPLTRGAVGQGPPKVEWRVVKTWAFWCGFMVLLLTSMGNFNPTLWIPSFADAVGATKPGGVALVSIMNASSVPGNAVVGYLSDRVPTKVMNVATCLCGALSVLLLWGFGTTTAPLVVFALVWGGTALCFVSLWSKIITRICKDDPTLNVLCFSLFAVLRGVGNVTAGPISTSLLKTAAFRGAAGAYGSTNFGAVLIYTAATTFAGGLVGAFFPA